MAMLAEFAGPAAQAALLARELGIPCVGGIARIMELTHAGDNMIVDDTKGLAFVTPDRETTRAYERATEERQ